MSEEVLLAQAHQAMLQMRFKDAIAIYDKVLQRNPSSVAPIYFKGQALSNLQNDEEALRWFDRALALLDPTSEFAADVLVNKGNSLLWMERVGESEECFDRALRIKPRVARIWVEKARAAVHRKNFNDSIEYCDRALSIDQSDARAWNNKAFALLQLNKLDDCIKCTQKAISLKPDYTAAWLWQGQAYERKGDQQRANECFANAEKFGQAGMFQETKGHKPVATTKRDKKWWKF